MGSYRVLRCASRPSRLGCLVDHGKSTEEPDMVNRASGVMTHVRLSHSLVLGRWDRNTCVILDPIIHMRLPGHVN